MGLLGLSACQPVLDILQIVLTQHRGAGAESRVSECLRAWQWLQNAVRVADVHQPELPARVQVLVGRLQLSVTDDPGPPPRWLARLVTDEVEQSAQAVLCGELKTRLAQVETTLDAHFRLAANHPPDRKALEALEPVFHDLQGTFILLGEDDAAGVVAASARKVRSLIESGHAMTPAQATARREVPRPPGVNL